MAFTQNNILPYFFEDDFQPFAATEDQLAPGEENYDIKEEFVFEEIEEASCEGIEFNSCEVIEPEMPPMATSSPRKGSMPRSLESPESSFIAESSFLEFQTPISPSTYVSSNFSEIASPRSPLGSPFSSEIETRNRKRKAEEDFFTVKKVKRSLFSEESTTL